MDKLNEDLVIFNEIDYHCSKAGYWIFKNSLKDVYSIYCQHYSYGFLKIIKLG